MNAMMSTAMRRPLMASVRELVWFDLRRFRIVAAVVVGLELCRAAFAEWSLQLQAVAIGSEFGGTFGTPEMTMLDAVMLAATVLATVTIVQGDLPSDDRAFWRTRPIAPVVLGLAKAVTLTLLAVVVPSAINAVRLALHGAPPQAMAAGAIQLAVLGGMIVVPAWALALIARTPARFMAVAAGALLASLALGAWISWLSAWAGPRANIANGISGPDWLALGPWGWWMALALLVCWTAVLVAHYHHHRRSATLAAAAVLLAAPLAAPERSPSTSAPAGLVSLVGGRVGVIGLEAPGQIYMEARRRSLSSWPLPLGVILTLPDLPSDLSATVITRNTRLIGRTTVPASSAWQCCFSAGPIGVVTPTRPAPASTPAQFAVDAAGLDALRGVPVSIRADAEIRFQRHRLAGSLPLREGASIDVDGQRVEILAVEARQPVVLVRYTAMPSLAGHSVLTLFVGDSDRSSLSMTTPGWRETAPMTRVSAARRVRFAGRNWAGRYHLLVQGNDEVRPDARLYVVESRDAGTVETPLAVDGLRLLPPAGDRR